MINETINIEKLKELIVRCKRLSDDKGLSEDDTRAKLIDPLLKEVLGWEEEYLVRQPSVETKDSIKRPDYWYPKIPKVIVEAKKLSVDLRLSNFDEQVLEYAYNRAVNIAILTNFRWFKAWYISSNGKISPFCYLDLTSASLDDIETQLKWFSNTCLLTNKIEEEAKRRGMQIGEIDISNELTTSINLVREKINNYLKKEYQTKYSDEEREEFTQGIINRLIFIKKIEAEWLEDKKLESLIRRNSNNIYNKLKEIFKYYREEYDSDIFGKPNEKSEIEKLEINDNVAEEILDVISHPLNKKLNYNFAAIDQDILGNMYENYLAYVQKRAKLIGGKSHKKARGIYYTPKYIVDYILQNTLGEKLKIAKLNEVRKLKILDPACGSGSFLITAVRLLDEYYAKNFRDYGNFSSTQKLNIIKENIFGVDLDEKAIKIAELNIYLTILTLSKNKSLVKGELLPALHYSLRNGNSIIDDRNIAGDVAFKWEEEFKEILSGGGFEVIIGNPPYGAELNGIERKYVEKKFKYSKNNKNTALIFIEKSLELLNQKGYFGMIVPKSLAFSQLWNKGRQLIKDHLIKVVDVSKGFKDVLLEQVIIILDKNNKLKSYKIEDFGSINSISIDKNYIDTTDSIILHGNQEDFKIFQKLNTDCIYLSEVSKTIRGLPFQKWLTKKETAYPVIRGRNISRYCVFDVNEYLPTEIAIKNKNKINFLMQPKIISQRIIAHITKPKDHIMIMSSLDKKGVLTVDTVENTIITNKEYTLDFILCLLNSKLISWYSYRYIFSKAIRTMDLDEYYLGKIPLPKIKINNDLFKNFSEKILSIEEKLSKLGTKITVEKNRLREERDSIEKQINQKIYELYSLTAEEIKLVEDS